MRTVRSIAATSMVLICLAGIGVGSAMFVGYLADRAKERAARAAPADPAPVVVASDAPVRKPVAAIRPVQSVTETSAAAPATVAAKPAEPPLPTAAPAQPSQTADASVPDTETQAPSDTAPTSAVSSYDTVEQAPDDSQDAANTGSEQTAALPKPTVKNATTGDMRKVNRSVNMRASPAKGAKVLMVIPASSKISVMSCDHWCEVVFNGKKGWIYKSFLGKS